MNTRKGWRAGALALAAAGLLAGCEDRRAPKLDEAPKPEELRDEGREGVERAGEAAERTGERLSPEGDRR